MSNRPAETEYSALQALLQIRTNSGLEGGSTGEGAGPQSANDDLAAAANGNQAVTVVPSAELVNLMRMSTNPASLLQQAQLTYPPAQLAAIQAAAAAASGHGTLLLQNSTFPASAIHSPYQAATAFAPSSVATAPTLDMQQSPSLSPLRPAPPRLAPDTGTMIAHGETLDGSGKKESMEEKKIRKDEVEAALRSKPQRGRKRENLNAEERLELTRTRNREHAKSTR